MAPKLHRTSKYLLCLLLAAIGMFSTIFFFYPIRNVGLVLPFIVLVLLFLLLYKGFFSERPFIDYSKVTSKKKVVIAIFAAIFSAALIFSLKGPQTFLLDNSWMTKFVVYIGTFLTLFFFVIAIIFLALKIEIKVNYQQVSKRKIIYYALPSLFVWLLYYIAFYPAGMTPDSLAQWDQAHTGEFNDWHPIVFTWFIMLLTIIWDSPAIVSLAQILIISFIFGYAAYRFEVFGFNQKLLWVIAVIFAISPINGIYSITIWKDVLYSAFLFFFSMVVLNIVVTKGKWLQHNHNIALFLLSALGIIFWRHNGLPVFMVTVLLLLIFYRQQFKRLLLIFFLGFAINWIITGPVYSALDVIPSDPNEALSIPTQQLATVILNDGELTDEQREYLDRIFPIELWKERFHPYNTNPIKFSWAEYDRDVIFDDFPKYVKTWLEICLQNPKLAIQGFLTHTSLVWQINPPEEPGYTDTYVTNVYYGNEQGIVNPVFFPKFTFYMSKYLMLSKEILSSIIWRPATYLFGIILFSFVALLRNDFKSLFVPLPVLLNVAAVMAAMPAQDFRYLYSNTIVIYLLLIFMFLNYKKSGDELT